MKKYLAELIGTFFLAFTVAVALRGLFPVATPLLAGLCLGLLVFTIGSISGAHVNPGVTIGLLSIGKISLNDAIKYIIAQLIGGAVAMVAAQQLLTPVSLVAGNSSILVVAEALGALVFGFGIAAVASGKVPGDVAGFTVGGSLLLGLSIAGGLGSNAVLNPAIALGIGSLSLTYVLAPVLGFILGMQLYKYLLDDSK